MQNTIQIKKQPLFHTQLKTKQMNAHSKIVNKSQTVPFDQAGMGLIGTDRSNHNSIQIYLKFQKCNVQLYRNISRFLISSQKEMRSTARRLQQQS